MIARVSAIQIIKEKEERAIEIIEGVLKEAETVKGYRGAQFLTDSDSGKGCVISYWDTIDDAIANEESGWDQEQIDKFNEVYAVPLALLGRYNVLYQDWLI